MQRGISSTVSCIVLRQRIFTALIAAGTLVGLLHLPHRIGFYMVWLGGGLLLLHEWMQGEKVRLPDRLLLAGPILLYWLHFLDPIMRKAAVGGFIGLAGIGLWKKDLPAAWAWQRRLVYGFLILGTGWGSVGWVLHEPYSVGRTLAFLSLVWVADSAGYLVGRSLGRTLILPHITPKKTVEGFAGSLIATGVWGYWAVPWVGGFEALHPVLVGAAVAVIAFIGDASQSLWKRIHGLKDSGNLLPGHGGFWDRVDALLWVAPFWYFLGA